MHSRKAKEDYKINSSELNSIFILQEFATGWFPQYRSWTTSTKSSLSIDCWLSIIKVTEMVICPGTSKILNEKLSQLYISRQSSLHWRKLLLRIDPVIHIFPVTGRVFVLFMMAHSLTFWNRYFYFMAMLLKMCNNSPNDTLQPNLLDLSKSFWMPK